MASFGQKSAHTVTIEHKPGVSGEAPGNVAAKVPVSSGYTGATDATTSLGEAFQASKLALFHFGNFVRVGFRCSVAVIGATFDRWRRTVPNDVIARIVAIGASAAKLGAPTFKSYLPRRDAFRLNGRSTARRIFAGGLALMAVLALYVAYALLTLPDDGGLDAGSHSAITFNASNDKLFATRGVFKGEELQAADLPPHFAQAVVAIEDRRFYQHYGIDLQGIIRAAFRNFTAGATREGGSTITQQLARLSYLSPERTVRRKVQEALLALWLETRMTKEQILLSYLNTAYFGAGAYGADAAAKRYFGKPGKELSLSEAAMLAGLLRAPSQLAPTRNFGGAQQRAELVLQAMADTGELTAEQVRSAADRPAKLRTSPETPPGANYFLDVAANETRRVSNQEPGDLTVQTTLDVELQRVAEAVVQRRLETAGRRRNVSQAALIAIRPDGAVVAMVGGVDYETSQFNRATQARRQAGSLFKLFVYLAALEHGYTPQSMLADQPIQIGEWEPQNANGRFRGAVTLRTAFAQSINTVAVQLADEIGLPVIINTAKRLGVQSNLPSVPSLALGSGDVTLVEMTRAYASVLAGNDNFEAYTIKAVIDGTGQRLYTRQATRSVENSRSNATRAMMLDLLQAVVHEGTGRSARIRGVAVAGKTGTSQDYRDAWFVGFTQDLVVGVWVGNDDNTPTRGVVGGDLPAGIWNDFMTRALPAMKSKPLASAVAAGGAPSTTGVASVRQALRGRARALDTGTLEIGASVVRLQGVVGERGSMADRLDRLLRRREVVCEAVNGADVHQCKIGDEDLSEIVLAGGGARVQQDAPAYLVAAEEYARAARLGIWRGSRR